MTLQKFVAVNYKIQISDLFYYIQWQIHRCRGSKQQQFFSPSIFVYSKNKMKTILISFTDIFIHYTNFTYKGLHTYVYRFLFDEKIIIFLHFSVVNF